MIGIGARVEGKMSCLSFYRGLAGLHIASNNKRQCVLITDMRGMLISTLIMYVLVLLQTYCTMV